MWNERRAREALLDTFGDVRMDGTMASISGTDSPNILITKSLQQYIEQTQDISVLMEERPYFDDDSHRQGLDARLSRVYVGTLLEHLLVLHLVAFYGNVNAKQAIDMAECMTCIADWVQMLLDKQGERYLEIAVELDVLLAHREDLLKEEGYGEQVLEQYLKSVRAERMGVKTHLPAKLIIDSLLSKAKWLRGKEDEDEL